MCAAAHPSAYTRWSSRAIDDYFLAGGLVFGLLASRYPAKPIPQPDTGEMTVSRYPGRASKLAGRRNSPFLSFARRHLCRDPPSKRPSIPRRSAYAAGAWGLLFAAVHAYWALGGTGGLEGERVTAGLLIIDVIAIPLCLLAALIAYATVRPSLWPAPAWMLRAGAWTASVALGLRGLTGLAQTALGQGGDVPWGVAAADPFFLLGGLLFGATAHYHSRVARYRPPPQTLDAALPATDPAPRPPAPHRVSRTDKHRTTGP